MDLFGDFFDAGEDDEWFSFTLAAEEGEDGDGEQQVLQNIKEDDL